MTVLDRDTLARRAILEKMERRTPAERLAAAVRAGILTEDGKFTAPYRDEEWIDRGSRAGTKARPKGRATKRSATKRRATKRKSR
jgi:hypothetical protein